LDRIFVGNGGGVCNLFDGSSHELLKSLPFRGADNVRFDLRTGLLYLGHRALAVIDATWMMGKTHIILLGSARAFSRARNRPRLGWPEHHSSTRTAAASSSVCRGKRGKTGRRSGCTKPALDHARVTARRSDSDCRRIPSMNRITRGGRGDAPRTYDAAAERGAD